MTRPSAPDRSRLPAYQRIARRIRERIAQGLYVADEYLPAERALAEEFRASRQTVRLAVDALREEGLVVPEQGRGTRVVRRSSDEPVLAGSLNLAALIIYGMSRDGSVAMLQGCQGAMREAGHQLIVCETPRDTELRAASEAAYIREMLSKGVEGLIIYAEPTDENLSLLQEAVTAGVKVVQIDRHLPGLDCDFVGVDNEAAAGAMVEHLWQTGHRGVAFLSIQPEPSTCRERLQGFLDAAGRLGVEASVAFCSSPDRSTGDVPALLRRWMAQDRPPSAVFAANDGLAMVVMEAARSQCLRMPQDVCVVGFDNLSVGEYLTPPLTTVQQPFVEIGQTAAQLLVDRTSGRYRGVPRQVRLPTELVIRTSCGVSVSSAARTGSGGTASSACRRETPAQARKTSQGDERA